MEKYEKLVWSVARRAANYLQVNVEEVLGMAYLAVEKCWARFDESKGVKFITYAYRNALLLVLNEWDDEKHTAVKRGCRFRIQKAEEALMKSGKPLTDENIMEEAGYSLLKTVVANRKSLINERVEKPYSNAETKIDWELVRHLMATEKEYQALRMRFFEGMEAKEIAELLGVTPGLIFARLHRAISRLKQSAKFTNNHQHLLGV